MNYLSCSWNTISTFCHKTSVTTSAFRLIVIDAPCRSSGSVRAGTYVSTACLVISQVEEGVAPFAIGISFVFAFFGSVTIFTFTYVWYALIIDFFLTVSASGVCGG
jgi:hypothetical protein